MSNTGSYLYGFTDRAFQPPPDLRGLRGAAISVIAFADVAAVVSEHPVQRLAPARSNMEPHHRVVRHVSGQAPLVPAAFGHVGDSEADIVAVMQSNYAEIRREIDRLAHKCEIGLKVSWRVDNIFNHLVRTCSELRDARDRIFRGRTPSMNEKLQLGSLFEATLARERERLTPLLLRPFASVVCDVFHSPARDEKTILQTALLVERARVDTFEAALPQAAAGFDASIAIEYSGPWPPYSFVRLRLSPAGAPIAA
jgi:Gas vesicle synthesis protein GvpL/GvpF